ncbi:hypothetical protein L873DRAFT_1187334 [Choiromyces venosus 120613-1]|uniref:Uncharacterized protein n=1 Tax=Choiromyces venosus 120613-1 TaxID=1336337 RepID=A0A3N4K6G5_9PEZI|nr:hypothetical protein L873DRAFT_1187334 [Choiromyces venosus 120613-1]
MAAKMAAEISWMSKALLESCSTNVTKLVLILYSAIFAKYALPISGVVGPWGASVMQLADSYLGRREAKLQREQEAEGRRAEAPLWFEKETLKVELLRQQLERGKVGPLPEPPTTPKAP